MWRSDLVGVYLHGSLATGCFNPACSDLDLLAVLRRDLSPSERRDLAGLMLARSGAPIPLEISILHLKDLWPWRHPTPYIFHYSKDWRDRFNQTLTSGDEASIATLGVEGDGLDEDLAGHVTITRMRGICLWGAPIASVFPPVPAQDYAASIVADLHWARNRLQQYPIYAVLNMCRVYAFLRDGLVCSKQEGAEWALGVLAPELHALIHASLGAYGGDGRTPSLDPERLVFFADTLVARVMELYSPPA
jgi:streptomycin 3"-adenylyltransferase